MIYGNEMFMTIIWTKLMFGKVLQSTSKIWQEYLEIPWGGLCVLMYFKCSVSL